MVARVQCGFHSRNKVRKFFYLFVGNSQDALFGRHRLDSEPDREDVFHLGTRNRADIDPAMRHDADEPLSFKLPKGFSYGNQAHSELLSKRILMDSLLGA